MDYSSGYGKRPMWQWVLIYLIVGGLIYGLVYYLYLSKKGTSPYGTTSSQTVNQNTVSYSNSGFQPKNISIKAGDTVTWTNTGDVDVSINSDPHPIHTGYPPLNIGIVSSNKSAALIFPTPGIYKYHNHLNASQNGSITVQ